MAVAVAMAADVRQEAILVELWLVFEEYYRCTVCRVTCLTQGNSALAPATFFHPVGVIVSRGSRRRGILARILTEVAPNRKDQKVVEFDVRNTAWLERSLPPSHCQGRPLSLAPPER